MSRKRELTYVKSTNQWCKTINGKRKYFGKGRSKSNEEDYQVALKKYHSFIADLDKNPSLISTTPTAIENEKKAKKNPKKYKYAVNQLSKCVSRWTEYQMSRVTDLEGGVSHSSGITLGRVISLKGYIKPWVDFYGARKQLSKLRPIDLENYRNLQVGLMQEGLISQNTVYQRFASLKNFLNFCWEREIIQNLPRNMKSDLKMGMKRDRPSIKDIFDWKKGEVKKLHLACANHSPAMELWFLLALNCGFLVKEISDLKMNDCLWRKQGWTKVIRERQKTGTPSEHTLWSRTEELWKELCVGRYGTEDICFARKDGQPLCTYKNGFKNESVGTTMKGIIRDTFGEDDHRSIRTLRKTGSSFISARFPLVDSLYLANKPTSVAQQHYSVANYKILHEALSYMEVDFGIATRLSKRHLRKPAQRSKKKP